MNKIEWLKLLHDKKLIRNDEAFFLNEEDRADGLTSVDEKIDIEFVGEYGENFAEVKDGNNLITIMRGQEGIDEYVMDKIRYMESDDLINLIRQIPGGLRSILESAWNWKLQDDGEYTMSITTTASLNTSKLLRLADRLDRKGLFSEANELDELIVAHCGTCHLDKKKKKKKKAAQLVFAIVKRALRVNPMAATVPIEAYERALNNEAERMGVPKVEVNNFLNQIRGKTIGDIIDLIDTETPVHQALVQVLSVTDALFD